MDRTEIVAYKVSEGLVFGGRVRLRRIMSKNRNFHSLWRKIDEPQSGDFKKALNVASSPLKNFNQKKRRNGCHNRGFRLMMMILS